MKKLLLLLLLLLLLKVIQREELRCDKRKDTLVRLLDMRDV